MSRSKEIEDRLEELGALLRESYFNGNLDTVEIHREQIALFDERKTLSEK